MKRKNLLYVGWGMMILGIGVFLFFIESRITVLPGNAYVSEQTESANIQFTGDLLISPYGAEESLIDLFSSAKYEMKGWWYQITENDFITIFRNSSLLGRKISLIVESETYGGSQKEFDTLQKKRDGSNIELLDDEQMGTNFVHAKTMVIDKEISLIASANLSYPSLWRNREYRFITRDTDIATNLSEIYQKDRQGEVIEEMDIHPSLLICPIDCREKIAHAIEHATESVWIAIQYVEDYEVLRLLEKRSKEIDVKILVGEYQDMKVLGDLSPFVRVFTEQYLHAKELLIDGRVLLHGSMNLSTNALDNNREIGIAIRDPYSLAIFKNQFEKDWQSADVATWDN